MARQPGKLQMAAKKVRRMLLENDGISEGCDIFKPQIGNQYTDKEKVIMADTERRFHIWFRSWVKADLEILVNAHKSK